MKRIFLMMLAVAGMAATSCERSFDDGGVAVGNEAKVSVNIEFPAMQTRAAYSDGTTATELQYAVFEKKNDVLKRIETYTVDSDNPEEIHISKQIEFQLVTGRTYQFVFWAAAPSEGDDWTNPYTVEFTEEGATMEVDYSKILANDERNDAFFASVEKEITGDVQMSVELTRPFAQINIGTSDYEVAEDQECAPDLSQIVLNKAYTTLDLVTGAATGNNGATTFAFNDIDSSKKFPIDNYEYLAMTYVLASAEEEADYTVTFSYKEGADGDVTDRTVGSVPVRRNFRTNMFGQVLTSTASVNVIIVPEYEEPDYNYSQLLFAAAVGGTAVLDDDVDLNEHGDVLTFTRDAVIDLNGKKITGLNGKDGAIRVTNGAHVTIKGDGQIVSTDAEHSTVVWVADVNSSVTIEDGYFEGLGDDDQLIYCEAGTIYIKGGTFKLPDHDYTLNCKDANARNETAKFVVTGGKFWNFDPSASKAEGNPIRNWVPAGYKSVETTIDDEVWYVVVPDAVVVVNNEEDLKTNLAEDGATVYITGGTYSSLPNSSFGKDVTLICDEGTKFTGPNNMDIKGGTVQGASFVGGTSSTRTATGTVNGTFRDCEFTGVEALRYAYAKENQPVVFDNCVFSGSLYGAHFDGSTGGEITFKDCVLSGFNALAASLNLVTFDGCVFKSNGLANYNGINLWGTTVIKDTEFIFDGSCATEWIDVKKDATFSNVKINGILVTADVDEAIKKYIYNFDNIIFQN